ncbi:MAG: amidohydrolase family protein [Armatimonadota bacterium]
MTNEERYEQFDLPFYQQVVAPALPAQVLDFHNHTWERAQWKETPWETDNKGARYMVTLQEYPVDRLLADGRMLFPDRPYHAVCFGLPTPAADIEKTNAYTCGLTKHQGLYPLLLAGRGLQSLEALEQGIVEGGCYGYKVFLNWYGDNYGDITIPDMLGEGEMALAEKYGLVVLLHVPRSGRLADPVVQQGVRDLSRGYPNARIVLAHCGRCYLPDEMQAAIGAVEDLENVYLDTAMVMDPTVLQIVLERIDARRVVFATDLPIAAMRGRRVYVADHWVDLVLEGNPPSAYRVASDNMRATFMVYEIILAIRRAAERAGLTRAQADGIFYDNGMALLQRVRMKG